MRKLSRFNLLLITFAIITVVGSMSGTALMQRQAGDKQAPIKPTPTPVVPVDINGKAIAEGEKYVAQRATKDGKVIAYRQNQREVEALVKGLKEDGVTDKKLLDTKYWLAAVCKFIGPKKCEGHCGGNYCKFYSFGGAQNHERVAINPSPHGFCACPN